MIFQGKQLYQSVLHTAVGLVPVIRHILKENPELYDFELTDEEMEKINALDREEKHDWY